MAPLPKSRIFTVFAAAFLVGIFIASVTHINFVFSWPILLLAIISSFLVALTNFSLDNHNLVIISYAVAFIAIGIGYYSYQDYRTSFDWPYEEPVKITGVIDSRPTLELSGQEFILKVLSLGGQEISNSKKPRLLVQTPRFPRYNYGELIEFSGTVEKPGMINDFDYGKYLKKYPIYGTVKHPASSIKLSGPKGVPRNATAQIFNLAERLEDTLNQTLPEPHASLAAGIIFGQKRNLSDEFKSELATTGLTHLVALSGYNVTILFSALSGLLAVRIGRRRSFWISLLLLMLFVLMTGAPSSIMRAAVFSVMILLGRTILGRQGDQINLLLLAAVILVIANPFLLYYDISFQLSFLAFIGLIAVSPLIAKKIEHYKHLPNYFKGTLAETLGAQITVLPLILVSFGQLSFVAPIANVCVLGVVPAVMALAFSAAIMGLLSVPLAKLCSLLLWPLLQYMIGAIRLFSHVPLAAITIEHFSWIMGVALAIIITGIVGIQHAVLKSKIKNQISKI